MKYKKFSTLTLFLFISIVCNAQFMALSLPKQNIVYYGMDNPIEIAVSNFPLSSIRVKANKGTITGENGKYYLRPSEIGICVVIVEIINKGKVKASSHFPLRVKEISDSYAHVSGKRSGNYDLVAFKAQLGVGVDLNGEYGFDARVEVKSFKSIIIKDSTKQSNIFESSGPYFSKEMKEEMKQLQLNDIVIIYDIIGLYPDGKKRNQDPLVYTME